jgi:hypothetical protein
MVLLKRFGEVLIHLCLDALLSITKHSMGGEGDDGRPLRSEASFIFTDLGCGFESSLIIR